MVQLLNKKRYQSWADGESGELVAPNFFCLASQNAIVEEMNQLENFIWLVNWYLRAQLCAQVLHYQIDEGRVLGVSKKAQISPNFMFLSILSGHLVFNLIE